MFKSQELSCMCPTTSGVEAGDLGHGGLGFSFKLYP